MGFLLTKLPWEVSLCCPDPAAASAQQFAVSLMEAMQLFVEHCVSQTLDTVHGKKKTSRKKRLLSLFLFVCSLFNADLPNLIHEMIPQVVVLAHLNECGSRHKGLKGSGGRAAHFSTKGHIPCN